jgi:hypothetical protein
LDALPTTHPHWTSATVFVLTMLVGTSIVGGLLLLSGHTNPVQTTVPGPYGAEGNQTETASGPGPQVAGLSPLPAGLVGNVPAIKASYDNMPFSGEQGSYCWAGIATTNQSTTAAARACHTAAPPTETTGIPTITVYPNATIYLGSPDQPSPTSLQATLFESGSMKLVKTNTSAMGGFALGLLPVGDYILMANASFGHSYTSDYYGIKQIGSVNYSEGSIKISIGSPSVEMATLTEPAGNKGSAGEMTGSSVGLETWPLTLSSATVVSGVNLTSISVIDGDWVRFLPSYLPEVGPNGTRASMLLAGAVRPFVNNDVSNVSMIIQAMARGADFGEVALPLEGSGGSVVLHSLAPNQEFQTGNVMVFAANQTNFVGVSIIYDPQSGSINRSLPVTASIAGLYEANGSVVPPPPWLQFSVPQASTNLSITPYDPLYFALDYTTSSAAPLGAYTFVVDLQVGGGSLSLYMPVNVTPPIYAGGQAG